VREGREALGGGEGEGSGAKKLEWIKIKNKK
jgi:hypothetical protein